jgi:hypothetical protein
MLVSSSLGRGASSALAERSGCRPTRGGAVEQFLPGQIAHSLDELVHAAGHDEIGAVLLEGLDRRSRLFGSSSGDDRTPILVGQIGVLLGAGEGKLLLNDLLIENEPGILITGL